MATIELFTAAGERAGTLPASTAVTMTKRLNADHRAMKQARRDNPAVAWCVIGTRKFVWRAEFKSFWWHGYVT